MLIPRAPGVPRSCQMDGYATSTKIGLRRLPYSSCEGSYIVPGVLLLTLMVRRYFMFVMMTFGGSMVIATLLAAVRTVVMGRGSWLVVVIACKTRFTLVNVPDNYIRIAHSGWEKRVMCALWVDPDEDDPDDNACHCLGGREKLGPPSPLLLQIKNTMITGGAGGGGRGGGGGGGGDKTLLDSSGVDIRRLYRIAKIMLFMAVVVLPGMVLHKSAYSSQFLPALISRSELKEFPLDIVLEKAAMGDKTVILTTVNGAWAAK
ncbi:hypothetical protein CK203_060965 [Vitis vinifera]|uniref:Uncharacterized protein n=1 Tax=Vitis vinifera TaxID=29760 RepID=A0A438G990_VITVI|nr:hypothetical protein CK203_060965 [Vitis vinifera]